MIWRRCVLVRYAGRKFIRIFVGIIGGLGLIVGSLQLTFIQKYILNSFVNTDFDKISGIFPFDFSIYNFKLKIENTDVQANKVYIKLGKKLNKIQQIDIEKIDIQTSKDELHNIDCRAYLPVLTQKIIRNIHVNKIIYNGKNVGKLHVTTIPKLYSSNFTLQTLNGTNIMLTAKITDVSLSVNGHFGELSTNILYNLQTDEVLATLKRHGENLLSVHGILKPNSLNGICTFTVARQNIVFKSELKNNIIYFEGYCAYNDGISTKADYDLNTNQIYIHELALGKRIFFKPFIIDKNFKIEKAEVIFPKGKISITNVDLKPVSFNPGEWVFENIDIYALQAHDTEKVYGLLNGKGYFKDSVEYFDLNLSNIEYGLFKIPVLKITGAYSKSSLDIKILYTILNKLNSIDIKAQPIDWMLDQNKQISIKAKGFFNLKDSIKKISNQIIGGKLKYDLLVTGTIGAPHYDGTLVLKNGIYINKFSNTFLRNGAIEIVIKNKNIIVKKIFATDDLKNPGKLTGDGRISFSNGEPNIDINIGIDSLEAIAMREFNGKLFGEMSINGNLAKEIKIIGNLHSNKAKFDISNFVNISNYAMEILDSLKTSHVVARTKQSRQLKVPLNINFKFVPNLNITGFGIDSVWHGGFDITGDISNISYKFETILDKGTIKVAGKKFDLKHGKVFCSNETNGNIDVEISAVKNIETHKVGAKFIQNRNGSDVVFFSKPYASKNDTLSYILFDKPTSEITTGEMLTLLNIMGKVSGTGGLDIIDKIKTVFGIDSIEIKQHDNADTGDKYNALSIGKKIGKLEISVDQGADKETTNIFVETEIAKNTKFSVDMRGKNNFGGGVLWSKRY